MANLRNPPSAGLRGATSKPKPGSISEPAIFETIYVQALAALEDGYKLPSSAPVALPSPVAKLIRKHGITDLKHKLLAIRFAAHRCTASTYRAGTGVAKKALVKDALTAARELRGWLRKLDRACGEDLIFEPVDNRSLAHPSDGSSFTVLPGPRKVLIEALDVFIANETMRISAPPSKGGRPLSYLNGATGVLARMLSDGHSFRLNLPDHLKLADKLFGDLFATASGGDETPRLRDAVERSRKAIHP